MKKLILEKILLPLFRLADGWKAIIGYLVVDIGGGDQMVVEAILAAIADPSVPNVLKAVGHVLLLVGLSWRAIKNVRPDLGKK